MSDNYNYLTATIIFTHCCLFKLGAKFSFLQENLGGKNDMYKSTGKRTYEEFN